VLPLFVIVPLHFIWFGDGTTLLHQNQDELSELLIYFTLKVLFISDSDDVPCDVAIEDSRSVSTNASFFCPGTYTCTFQSSRRRTRANVSVQVEVGT